jgi:hypothetical protein
VLAEGRISQSGRLIVELVDTGSTPVVILSRNFKINHPMRVVRPVGEHRRA